MKSSYGYFIFTESQDNLHFWPPIYDVCDDASAWQYL